MLTKGMECVLFRQQNIDSDANNYKNEEVN